MSVVLDPNLNVTVLTPPALSADANDYAPTGLSTATVLRLEASGSDRVITGMTGGIAGRLLILINVGTVFTITLTGESASSSAANRFSAGTGIGPGSVKALEYNGLVGRWQGSFSR